MLQLIIIHRPLQSLVSCFPAGVLALIYSSLRLAEIERLVMGVDVSTEVTIERPRAAVFAYAANPDKAPLWYVNIKSVEWRTPPPLGVESRVAFVARFLGRRLAYTYEIVELIPNERLVMRTAEGPFPMETRYFWSDADNGGTRMTLRNLGSPKGFSKLLRPVMAAAMRRANQKDLARLKELLEKQN